MKKLTLLVCAAVIVLAGCNTVKGAGQDISSGGNAISNAASQQVFRRITNSQRNNVMKRVVLIACAAVVFLAGCNTDKGAGQDISRGGQAVSDTATEVQHGM